jgi:transposase
VTSPDPLPAELAAAHAMIVAERAARRLAETRAQNAEAEVSGARLEIERLKLLLAKARREQYGQSSERGTKIIAQLELQLAELEETVAQEETTAEIAAPVSAPRPRSARKPARRPLPDHLPRERIVYPSPCTCPKCGGAVRKLGEDVTETLECVPRRWKVVEHVREKFTCRSCEAIAQPPAPSHPNIHGNLVRSGMDGHPGRHQLLFGHPGRCHSRLHWIIVAGERGQLLQQDGWRASRGYLRRGGRFANPAAR